MGFMSYHGVCPSCKRFFIANPDHVPSITIKGEREAICRACFEKWNEMHRTSKGLEPEPLHPNAYEPQEIS